MQKALPGLKGSQSLEFKGAEEAIDAVLAVPHQAVPAWLLLALLIIVVGVSSIFIPDLFGAIHTEEVTGHSGHAVYGCL